MNEKLLTYIRCPLCKSDLIFEAHNKETASVNKNVFITGIFSCDCGMIYPMVHNIPRLLPESFLDYETIIDNFIPDYHKIKQAIMHKYSSLISDSRKNNNTVKRTFGFEWSLLKDNKQVNIWNLTKKEFEQQLWDELKIPAEELKHMIVADVGCGHGRSGSLMADKSYTVFCMDVGLSIEEAAANNQKDNCFFLQADLHYLPFEDNLFDLVYSSGVLHHTPDTEAAFKKVSRVVKSKGTYCIWLYHPFNNLIHKTMLALRYITIYLPIRIQFWLYMIFLLPFHKLVSFIKGNKKGWREIMINQLDMLSPKYRHEHNAAEVINWYKKNNFTDVEITTSNTYGFSIKGRKDSINVKSGSLK